MYYGGGSYNPRLDPNALKEAERAAARNRTPPSRLRPAEPSHPPPKSILKNTILGQVWHNRESHIWYGTDDGQQEWVEVEPERTRMAKPPSPPKVYGLALDFVQGPTQSPSQVVPPRRREPPQRREPQTVFARTQLEGTSQKAEVKQLVPKGSVGRSMQPASAPKKLKAAKAYTVLERARRASAKKVKVAVEPDEASPKYLRPPREGTLGFLWPRLKFHRIPLRALKRASA